VQVRKRLGFLGLGIASGTVLIVPAVFANAASAASPDYNSTASATPGYVAVAGTSVTRSSTVTATDTNSSQGTSTGTPSGTPLPGGLGSIVPSQADLVSTKADASPAGTSDACSTVASGGCGAGTAQPLTVDLSLATILKQFGGSLPIGSLPVGLGQDSVVLSLTGPAAACTAGPTGGPGNGFTATQTPASGTVDIRNGSSSAIGGARQISGGDVLSGLTTGGMLGTVLQAIPANAVTLTYTPGSTSGAGAGPQSKAAAGKLALSVGKTSALSLVGGTVSCGSNQEAPAQNVSSSSPAGQSVPGGSTTSGSQPVTGSGGSSSTSSEKSLSGIQSDEGRYVPASSDTPLWAGLAGGGAALAGGLLLWRRRLHRA
jgi:hypothetical protein